MRIPKPSWKKSHKCFYVKLKGKFHRLDPDEATAFDIYRELLSRYNLREGLIASQQLTVRDLLATFLDWIESHRRADTHEWYRQYLLGTCAKKKTKLADAGFANYVPPNLLVRDMKPFHLNNWLDARYPDASDTTRSGAMAAVIGAFNWARREGYISANPLADMKRPKSQPRGKRAFLMPDQWRKLIEVATSTAPQGPWTTKPTVAGRVRQILRNNPDMASKQLKTILASEGLRASYSNIAMARRSLDVADRIKKPIDPFVDYLKVMRLTGCRPQEIRRVEARHINHEAKSWVFKATKKERIKATQEDDRVIHLGDEAYQICCRLIEKHPSGPIFRNSWGRVWTKHAVACRFTNLSKEVGFKVFSYAVRHTFASEAIIAGVDLITIARLMGHKNLTMLNLIYEHVMKDSAHIEASRARANERIA